jgi:hypothetical protein
MNRRSFLVAPLALLPPAKATAALPQPILGTVVSIGPWITYVHNTSTGKIVKYIQHSER